MTRAQADTLRAPNAKTLLFPSRPPAGGLEPEAALSGRIMTHEDLRRAAVRWLTSRKRCSVVLSEMTSSAMEIPDAIGWKYASSCLIECKMSRSDFRANGNKCFIRSGRGLGAQRYYLCPAEVITISDIEGCDYGLLWLIGDRRIKIVRDAPSRETDPHGEICMLVSALRRVKTREFLTIVADSGSEAPSVDISREIGYDGSELLSPGEPS